MKPIKLKRDEYRSRRESMGNGKLSGKDPKPALRFISKKFRKGGIRYAVIGSMSLRLHGIDLSPDDIDIVIREKDAGKVNRMFKEFLIKPIPIGKTDYGWGNSNFGLFRINDYNVEIGYPPTKTQKTDIYIPRENSAKDVRFNGITVAVCPVLEMFYAYGNWYGISKRGKDLKKIELIRKFFRDNAKIRAASFDMKAAKQKLIKHKSTRYTDQIQHARIVKWAETHKPVRIFGRPVWIVPHSYVNSRWAIRPFGLLFVSDRFPKWALNNVVYHELVEEGAEHKKSIKNPHLYATGQELYYIIGHGLLSKSIKWMERTNKNILRVRLKEWKEEGYKVSREM